MKNQHDKKLGLAIMIIRLAKLDKKNIIRSNAMLFYDL